LRQWRRLRTPAATAPSPRRPPRTCQPRLWLPAALR
jgi:hypothetical protein